MLEDILKRISQLQQNLEFAKKQFSETGFRNWAEGIKQTESSIKREKIKLADYGKSSLFLVTFYCPKGRSQVLLSSVHQSEIEELLMLEHQATIIEQIIELPTKSILKQKITIQPR